MHPPHTTSQSTEAPPQESQTPSRSAWWSRLTFAIQLVAMIAAVLTARASVADHYHVPTGSMEPTIQIGDRILVNKLAYGLRLPMFEMRLFERAPSRGDVIVFMAPHEETVMVKRLIGLPGDRLAFDGRQVTINGEPAAASRRPDGSLWEDLGGVTHPLHPESYQGPRQLPLKIPQGQYFVMGDHRGNSSDSRVWGLVPEENLLGRAVAVIYSDERDLPWSERWWIPLSLTGSASADPRLAR
ncbi:MAG: signal peptidase I [Myxococcota bacterium]